MLLLVSTVATALQKDPQTFGRVAEVVSMGGALDVPGNTSPTAEFNFFADPYVTLSCYTQQKLLLTRDLVSHAGMKKDSLQKL